MKDEDKTKEQLVKELANYRKRITELEKSENEYKKAEEKINRRSRELAALNTVAAVVSQSLNLDEILNNALDKVLEIMNLKAGGIYLSDPRHNKLDLVVHRGISKEFVREIKTLNVDEKTLKAVVAEGKMKKFILHVREVMKNRAQMSRILSAMKKEGLSVNSGANVLLQAKEEIQGLITLSSHVPRRFSEAEHNLLISIGNQIAVAIENSRLYEKSQQELTERKRTEVALQVKQAYLEHLFESAPEAIVMNTNDGKILSVSSEFVRLFGYSRKEAIGQSLDKLVASKELFDEAVSITKRVAEGERVSLETVRSRKDGTRFNVSIFGAPIIIDNKQAAVYSIYRDITERKQAEEKIAASLKEKELLLQEIHHRVKNNMQIVSSLLRLQSSNIKDKGIREMFKASQSRIQSMSLIHEKLYQSKDFSEINFAQYIRSLIVHLFHTYRVDTNIVKLKTEMEDVFLDINTAIPCSLITNELVSNSLKYAFPGGKEGEIGVILHKDKQGKFLLVIRDNGIGFPEKIDFRNPNTLGLQLVNDLVKQINGKIELDRTGGTEFKIKFKN